MAMYPKTFKGELSLSFQTCSSYLLWQSTADTFHIAMNGLATTQSLIEKLELFNAHKLQGYSLSCYELSRINFNGLAPLLSSLRSSSINFSDEAPEKQNGRQPLDKAERI